jgi:YVTN family beta-propeller protein
MRYLVIFILACLSVLPAAAQDVSGYEIWLTDQTNDRLLVYEGDTWELLHEIDLAAPDRDRGTSKPHMITFSPDERYAYVANVGSPAQTNNVVVIDTQTYEPVATLMTGASAHAAVPSPDGSRIWVANINEHHLTEILFDSAAGTWTVSRKVPSYGMRPICLWFTADGSTVYVTNGGTPGVVGSLSIINVESGALITQLSEFGREACGTVLSHDGNRMYSNTGFHHDNAPEQNDNVFIFDTSDHSVIASTQLEGQDAHGLQESPDGAEIWVVGRASATVEIFDALTLEPLAIIEDAGSRPDLAAFSPDGRFFITSQRGMAVTGDAHAVSGDTPGFAIIDVATRELVELISIEGDVHGLAVRDLS